MDCQCSEAFPTFPHINSSGIIDYETQVCSKCSKIRPRKKDGPKLCSNCGAFDFVLGFPDELMYCNQCGVYNGNNLWSPVNQPITKKATYNRRFYHNELKKQIQLDDPEVPNTVVNLLKKALKKRKGKRFKLTKKNISILCRSVCTREQRKLTGLKKRYWVRLSSKKAEELGSNFYKNRFVDLRKFAENWRQLCKRIKNKKFPLLEGFLEFYSRCIDAISYHFEFIRHDKKCSSLKGKKECKEKGCRKSLLQINFLINFIAEMYYNKKRIELVKKSKVSAEMRHLIRPESVLKKEKKMIQKQFPLKFNKKTSFNFNRYWVPLANSIKGNFIYSLHPFSKLAKKIKKI